MSSCYLRMPMVVAPNPEALATQLSRYPFMTSTKNQVFDSLPPPVHMRPPEPDPLRVDVINGWLLWARRNLVTYKYNLSLV